MDEQKKSRTVVSIVTPSYNQEQFIDKTIRSVISQEGDFFLDYIIIDGGSEDKSVETIKRYDSLLDEGKWQVQCRGIRYRWVSEKDSGQTDAIIKGFKLAEGEILAWLNSDDTYLEGALNKVVHFFRQNQSIGMVYGKTYYIDETGSTMGIYPTESFDVKKLASFTFITQSSTFLRKGAYVNVGGLNIDLHYTMDYDLWIRLSKKFEIEYLPEFLSTYRLHTESKTMSYYHTFQFHREYLETVMKYYNWAPLNRVYGYCDYLVKSKLPEKFAKNKLFVLMPAVFISVIKYIVLNRGIRGEDIRMINPRNLRKLFKDWIDIYKGY
jgi:glycosyltransferase involved in cell wall biosynthesis